MTSKKPKSTIAVQTAIGVVMNSPAPLQHQWVEEFGAEFAVPAVITEKLDDHSWHNDVCPSFKFKNDGGYTPPLLTLWVDHPDKKQREMNWEGRFIVIANDTEENLCTTDDVQEALDAMVKHLYKRTVQRMKREIVIDVRLKKIPKTVTSFSELHDYVDANEYGGFCDDNGILDSLIQFYGGRDLNEGIPDGAMKFMNDAQSEIDGWLCSSLMLAEIKKSI